MEKPIGKRLSKKQIWIFALGQLGWSILGGEEVSDQPAEASAVTIENEQSTAEQSAPNNDIEGE